MADYATLNLFGDDPQDSPATASKAAPGRIQPVEALVTGVAPVRPFNADLRRRQQQEQADICGSKPEQFAGVMRFTWEAKRLGYRMSFEEDPEEWSPAAASRLKNRVLGRVESDRPVGDPSEWAAALEMLPLFANTDERLRTSAQSRNPDSEPHSSESELGGGGGNGEI